MPWFSKGQAVQDGPGSAIDLRELAGHSGNLLFANGLRANQMVSIPCRLLRVDRTHIAVELAEGSARPAAESAVILEVLHHSALIQCFTFVERVEKSGPVLVRIPTRPHVVKRRKNPRVDIYLGVTLHTPDRPIEETPAQMINLSLDGAACVLAEPVQQGAQISINMSALGFNPPMVAANVVRCSPTPTHLWVIGFQFRQLLPEQERYLTEYIANFTGAVRHAQDESPEG